MFIKIKRNEAYYYWERSGILWEKPKVKEWLAQATGKGKHRRMVMSKVFGSRRLKLLNAG